MNSDYIKFEDNELSMVPLLSDNYDDSFLSQIRKRRNDNIITLQEESDKYTKKFLSIPVYNNLKLLNTDVDTIMNHIKRVASDKSMVTYDLNIKKDSWLLGFVELCSIYNKADAAYNKYFLKKYWQYVDNAIEMLLGSLVQKTGICRRDNAPVYAKNSKNVYEPSEGIYFKKDKSYMLNIWW